MRLTFVFCVAVLLVCVMIGDVATSFGEESDGGGGGGGGFFSADDPLDDSSPDGGNLDREREGGPSEVDLEDGALEAAKRGHTIREEGPWVKGHRPNRRAFSPWGGKRYFNPWGGKRFKSIYLERKANSIFDKRPGFQPWGGKRSSTQLDEDQFGDAPAEKRAFSPWGGKREAEAAVSRDHVSGLLIRRRRNEDKNLP